MKDAELSPINDLLTFTDVSSEAKRTRDDKETLSPILVFVIIMSSLIPKSVQGGIFRRHKEYGDEMERRIYCLSSP